MSVSLSAETFKRLQGSVALNDIILGFVALFRDAGPSGSGN